MGNLTIIGRFTPVRTSTRCVPRNDRLILEGGPRHRVVDRLDAHVGGDVEGDDPLDLSDDDPGGAHQFRGQRAVGNDDSSDHLVPLAGREERDKSRWTTTAASFPFPRIAPSASAIATDRCLPPVQPTPSVKYAFPSFL